jgi:hypothetical protein
MANTKEKWQEIANRGLQDRFDPTTRARFDEAVKRGLIALPGGQQAQQEPQTDLQQEALNQLNSEIGPVESTFIGMGRGLSDIGRAVGLVDEEPEIATRGLKGLEEERPFSQTIGRAVGQSLPFLAPGVGIGGITSTPLRKGKCH